MPLAATTRLGPYEIISPLGAGGMGEVYRARDTRLGREIAVKVLPEGVASDPDRLARFEREAKTVAALNHPSIVTLHSIEEAGGVRFLTMELAGGESLDRLVRPAAPPPPALSLRLDLPRDIDRVISRCLEKDPERRFQTAKDVRNELELVRRERESGVASGTRAVPAAAPEPAQDLPSIAVLPFVNMSRDEENEYF